MSQSQTLGKRGDVIVDTFKDGLALNVYCSPFAVELYDGKSVLKIAGFLILGYNGYVSVFVQISPFPGYAVSSHTFRVRL